MDLENAQLLSLQTNQMKQDLTTIGLCAALEPQIKQIAEEINLCLIYARIDDLDEHVVDELAWQFHVDFYDVGDDLEKKRELVKNSIIVHITKGTPHAVETLINTLTGEGRVSEWFEYGGEPYWFKVVISNEEVIQKNIIALKKALNTVKNKRSWLERVVISFKIKLKNKPNLKTLYKVLLNTKSETFLINNINTFNCSIFVEKPINDYVTSIQPIFNGQFYFNGQLNFDATDEEINNAPVNQFGTMKIKRNDLLVEEIRI